MIVSEQWLPVVGYEGLYEVSDHGRVRSLDRGSRKGRVLSLRVTGSGHKTVALYLLGKPTGKNVHRLVLIAFVGPCPQGMEACHNDGNPANNHLSNLRWDTHKSNMEDKVKHGTHHETNKTHCKRGHELLKVNLVPSNKNRSCLSCSRERTSCRDQNRDFDNERANQNYRQITEMKEEA